MKDAAALKGLARKHRRLIEHAADDGTASDLRALAEAYETLAEEAAPNLLLPPTLTP